MSEFVSHFRDVLANIVGVLDGSVPVLAVPGKPVQSGAFEPGLALFADRLTSSFVFVVRGHVADALVQPDGVVVLAHESQFGAQCRGVAGSRAGAGTRL